jgi:hypothetical protein
MMSFFIQLFFINPFDQIFTVKPLDCPKADNLGLPRATLKHIPLIDAPVKGIRYPKNRIMLSSVKRPLPVQRQQIIAQKEPTNQYFLPAPH